MSNVKKVKATNNTIKGLVDDAIREQGVGANLNFIDTSKVTDMNGLFRGTRFIGDISEWDVSKVKDIRHMFYSSVFQGDISKWDVSNVTRSEKAFMNARFSGDLSKWEMKSENDEKMFKGSRFSGKCNNKWYKNGEELDEAGYIEYQLEQLDL